MSPLGLRREEPPGDAVVVLRGGIMGVESVVRTATISFERYGFFGVSVFAAIDMTIENWLLERPS